MVWAIITLDNKEGAFSYHHGRKGKNDINTDEVAFLLKTGVFKNITNFSRIYVKEDLTGIKRKITLESL